MTSPQSCDVPPIPEELPSEEQVSEDVRVHALLTQLAEFRTEREDAQLADLRQHIIEHQLLLGPLNLEADHPLEEVGWLLLTVLLYHHGLGSPLLAKRLKAEDLARLLKKVQPIFKAVQQCKWRLFQQRQKLDQSHKEVCASVTDKCRLKHLFALQQITRTVYNFFFYIIAILIGQYNNKGSYCTEQDRRRRCASRDSFPGMVGDFTTLFGPSFVACVLISAPEKSQCLKKKTNKYFSSILASPTISSTLSAMIS